MVDLVINGKKLQRDEQTLFGEFLKGLNKDLSAHSQVISVLRIDGKTIDEGDENTFAMRALALATDSNSKTLESIYEGADSVSQITPTSRCSN